MTSSLARCSALLAPRLCPLPILVATSLQPRLSCPCIPRWVGRLHLETARALVVALDDPASADELVAAAAGTAGPADNCAPTRCSTCSASLSAWGFRCGT